MKIALNKPSKRGLTENSGNGGSLEDNVDNEVEMSESDEWDTDCRIVTTHSVQSITGCKYSLNHKIKFNNCINTDHLMPTCVRNPDEMPSKKQKWSVELRLDLSDPDYKAQFREKWDRKMEFTSNNTELMAKPFQACVVDNFLAMPDFLNQIREEFNDIQWKTRIMDLYEFFQSQDLKHLTNFEALSAFYNFLQTDVMQWVRDLTGADLTHVSATCSCYSNTDFLLVHDDQRDDRLIAFILYLTPQWHEDYGGALQLLNKDDSGQPNEVERQIFPKNNQFVFFPVTNDSYHNVDEVKSLTQCRLSINGWFHTKTNPIFETPLFTFLDNSLHGSIKYTASFFDGDLKSWITSTYLDQDVRVDIKDYFEENSEVQLKDFFRPEALSELMDIFSYNDLDWKRMGPPNRFNYDILNTENLPVVLDRFFQLFRSSQMFKMLDSYTGLSLYKKKYSMRFELQRWTPGSYSLLGNYDWYKEKELDAIICFGCNNSSDVIGARTVYVVTDDDEEDEKEAIITIDPGENSLSLIYRDTARFTSYFSKVSRSQCVYMLFCTYSK